MHFVTSMAVTTTRVKGLVLPVKTSQVTFHLIAVDQPDVWVGAEGTCVGVCMPSVGVQRCEGHWTHWTQWIVQFSVSCEDARSTLFSLPSIQLINRSTFAQLLHLSTLIMLLAIYSFTHHASRVASSVSRRYGTGETGPHTRWGCPWQPRRWQLGE